jgi:hypothetical protein
METAKILSLEWVNVIDLHPSRGGLFVNFLNRLVVYPWRSCAKLCSAAARYSSAVQMWPNLAVFSPLFDVVLFPFRIVGTSGFEQLRLVGNYPPIHLGAPTLWVFFLIL